MRVVVVLDHPYGIGSADDIPHERSFSAAAAAAAIRGLGRAGHDVDLIDLVPDRFDPVMRREDLLAWRSGSVINPLTRYYQRRVADAGHLVFVFPIWWEAMPAGTKGFLDKVLTKGVMFREDPDARGNPFSNLMTRLRGVTVLTVMTTPHSAYRWWFGNPVIKIMFRGTFAKIGVRGLRWRNYAGITSRTPAQRAQLLRDTEERFAALGDADAAAARQRS